jgi:hypothetical protein
VKRLQKLQDGLTIVELVIALTITTALMLVIVGFAVDKLRDSTIQSTKNDLLANAETGLTRITNDIRLANSADNANRWSDANAPGAPSNLYSWASGSSVVILATAAQDTDGNIIFDDAHDYVSAKNDTIYFVQNGTLWRRTLAAPNAGNRAKTSCPVASATSSCPADGRVLDNVSSFQAKYFDGSDTEVSPDSARSVQLTVTLLKRIYRQDISVTYTTRMVFRNG